MDFALFDTPLGRCGLAWTDQGIRALQLPEATPSCTVDRLRLSASGGTASAGAAARAVGRALGRNPFVIIVPCHRILAAGGRPGGFSAHGGLVSKHGLLSIEAAMTGQALPLFAVADRGAAKT